MSRLAEAAVRECSWPKDPDEFDTFVEKHEPVIFRGACLDHIPEELSAPSDQALDWLEAEIGHRVVPLTVGLPTDCGVVGTGAVDRGQGFPTTLSGKRLFRDVVAAMKAEMSEPTGHFMYAQSIPIREYIPEFAASLTTLLSALPPAGGQWRLWLGTGAHHVHAHWDAEDNFYCVLAGTKQFRLFRPEVMPYLYLGPIDGGPYGTLASVVHPTDPDLGKYPRYAAATEAAASVELTAGDVLYLPAHWWHDVRSVGFNISVNYWWTDIDERARIAADIAFMKSLLALRSLPRHWRDSWRALFDSFVFEAYGDPEAHLAPNERSPLLQQDSDGEALLIERLTSAEAGLARATRSRPGETGNGRSAPGTTYRMSPTVVLRLGANDSLILLDWSRGLEHELPASMLSLLQQFHGPQDPAIVVRSVAEESGFDEEEIDELVEDLVKEGLLLPC